MDVPLQNILRITVEPREEWIPVEAFLELLKDTLEILKDVDVNMSQSEHGVLDWEIVEASLNSPMRLSVKSRAQIGRDNGSEVIHAYIHGITNLQNGQVILPEFFSPRTLHKVQDMFVAFNEGIEKVSFATGNGNGEAVTVTKQAFSNLSAAIEKNADLQDEHITEISVFASYGPKIEERATIDGTLETVSVHGKNPVFVLYDSLTNTKIDCFFREEDFAEIQNLLSLKRNRVSVTGKARYGRSGNITSIRVESFRKLRDQSELPQFSDVEGINITNGVDPTEYVRRMRDEQ